MFDPTTFTGFHTWLSLLALASGAVTLAGLLSRRVPRGWTGAFLAFAIATSVTGYGFPMTGVITPAQVVGALALAILAAALLARHGRRPATYAACLVASEYLLAFVAVAQAFQKVPALAALGQGGFGAAQLIVLAGFLVLGVAVVRRFRGRALRPFRQVA
ncbi:hypothetical protein [Roseomonas populi]|uniref:Uncharacterized protein n=1 Tax=Roseomonas populi TaxID=3121582 RepID=A0ABT1WXH8_9PROT|nr:hypothetical protein [Roseomonas pecuniae]MCR0980540.1 hypothetical protein [Roseomonas pecuniae]